MGEYGRPAVGNRFVAARRGVILTSIMWLVVYLTGTDGINEMFCVLFFAGGRWIRARTNFTATQESGWRQQRVRPARRAARNLGFRPSQAEWDRLWKRRPLGCPISVSPVVSSKCNRSPASPTESQSLRRWDGTWLGAAQSSSLRWTRQNLVRKRIWTFCRNRGPPVRCPPAWGPTIYWRPASRIRSSATATGPASAERRRRWNTWRHPSPLCRRPGQQTPLNGASSPGLRRPKPRRLPARRSNFPTWKTPCPSLRFRPGNWRNSRGTSGDVQQTLHVQQLPRRRTSQPPPSKWWNPCNSHLPVWEAKLPERNRRPWRNRCNVAPPGAVRCISRRPRPLRRLRLPARISPRFRLAERPSPPPITTTSITTTTTTSK